VFVNICCYLFLFVAICCYFKLIWAPIHGYLKVGMRLELEERGQDVSWRGVGAVLEELPDKVMHALSGAIAQVPLDGFSWKP
jgi:hypothetical protein